MEKRCYLKVVIMAFLNKFLGDPNERTLKKLQPIVDEINKLEPQFERFSNEEIEKKSEELRTQFQGLTLRRQPYKVVALGSDPDLLPEAFALAREAAKRAIGQRHFDVQLLGGLVLHQGKIAEMKTGEGKTLAATLAVYLNALAGKGVHVVTVNDYLARRDANWMGPIYYLLGLSCACLNHEKAYLYEPQVVDKNEITVEMENLKEISRKEAYQADITYGTNNEFGFDYLRDNMAPSLEMMVQREPHFAIIDEVDSILIDEARTPLIISAPDAESTKMYEQFSKIIPQLKENADYNIDEKMRAATLTEEGVDKVEKILGLDNIYEEAGIRYVHHLEQALRAEVLFKRDRDYVVKDGQVIIVDEFTGRLMPGRRYSQGLHQALEAKEKVLVQPESRTLATITFQNYFRLYKKLAGMTGTALTSAEEFHKVYGLEAVVIPTNKPMIRQDLSDRIYKSEKGKFQAVVQEIKKRHENGQPVLVGTVSIVKNELLSVFLKKEGISHEVLNAKNHEREAQIIAGAGKKGAVTVATNMAGRGVDITLGGAPPNEIPNPKSQIPNNFEEWQKEHDEIIKLGGLYIIGTERHEARRIDNQLRGRSGRQGDPGSSQFFVSLEDDLMRIFGGEKIKNMMDFLKAPEDQPIENRMISKAIESAQAKIEGFNFDTRKHVLEYDDVVNKQREVIYKKRKEVLSSENLKSKILETIKDEIKRIVEFHTQGHADNWNYKEISEVIKSIFPIPRSHPERSDSGAKDPVENALRSFRNPEEISDYLVGLAREAYQEKEKEVEEKNMRQIEKFIMLRNIDVLWMEHLDNLEYLRDSVRLRAYGQKDPLVEYKNEGHRLFQKLLGAIQSNLVGTIYKVSLAPVSERNIITSEGERTKQSRGKISLPAEAQKAKVGRNSPCPCGSGKKFKKCHGR